MSDSPKEPAEPPEPFDASLIDSAPVEPDSLPVALGDQDLQEAYDSLIEYVGYLSDRLAETEAENEKLKAQQTIDQVKAALLKPFSRSVFWFVVGYCAVVGAMLILAGWGATTGFTLSDVILGIIAGSTAVSVIGLIGMVISGLFGGSKPSN